MQKTVVVVPCLNEADRLEKETFLHFAAANPSIHFLFVDDGSTDGTARVLAGLQQQNEHQFRFISRKKNLGKAESVREGIMAGAAWKDFELTGYFDADLATPLEEISWLLQHFNNDPELLMAFGSREKTDQNIIHRNPVRHAIGRVYAAFLTQTLRLDIYDTQCGAKFFKTQVALELFKKPFIDRWLFDVEVFCRLKKLYRRDTRSMFKEVTLREWSEKGQSRIRFVDLLFLPVQTTRIFFYYL
jgi:glycosyltransferase involved in cell wall biosynthesis